jgi:uncharacterized protein (DUF169 family)
VYLSQPKRKKQRGLIKAHYKLHNLCFLPNVIVIIKKKEGVTWMTCSIHGEMRNA